MDISVSSQAYVFLYSILGGMVIALIYDVFRIKRKKIRTRSLVLYLEDFMYWIIVSLVMLATIYYSNDGEIRGFIFIGTILGIAFYILVLSSIIMKISLKAVDITVKLLRTIWKIITYPFKIMFKILSIPLGLLKRLLRKAFKGARRVGRNSTTKLTLWGRMLRHRRKKI